MPTVSMGATVTLNWNVANTTGIKIVAAPGGDVTDSTMATGMVESGAINENTVFTLTAEGEGGPVTRTVSVNVMGVNPNAPTITSFTATPPMVATGAMTTLNWTTMDATQVRVLNGATELFNTDTMLNAGTFQVQVDVDSTYTLEATNNDGMATDTVSVTVAMVQTETEPNNDPNVDPLDDLTGGGIISGSISDPAMDLDFFMVTVTEGQNISALVLDADGVGCTIPSVVAIFEQGADPTADPPLAFNDDRAAGEACSAIDPALDNGASDLPAGTYIVGVGADNNAMASFDYQLTITVGSPGCGNGIAEASQNEQCDDGNTMAGDGCSATCTAEPIGTVNGVGQDQTFTDAIVPGQEDFFEVVLDADGYINARTGAPVLDMCEAGADTVLALYDSAFMEIASNDDGGQGLCSSLQANDEDDQLVAGTYFLGVRAFSATGTVSAYQLQVVTLASGCGNGISEPSQNEQCDDGNTMAGDGCSATCTAEFLGTVNGIGQDETFADSIDPGQEDFFEVVLDADGYINARTGAPVLDMCETGADTVLAVYDSSLMQVARNDDSGGTRCSTIEATSSANLLTAGTYIVGVRAFSATATVSAYEVQIQTVGTACGNGIPEPGEVCDDGNLMAGDGCDSMCQFEGTIITETEPNNDIMGANDSTATIGGGAVLLQGIIDPIGDVDIFSFTVPAGQTATLVASTGTDPVDPTICNEDTLIRLTDSMGMELTSDDDGGEGLCSLIDGNADMAASALAAGTYYVEVHHFDDSEAFTDNYFLSLSLQ